VSGAFKRTFRESEGHRKKSFIEMTEEHPPPRSSWHFERRTLTRVKLRSRIHERCKERHR
jgi:hypothetical protein